MGHNADIAKSLKGSNFSHFQFTWPKDSPSTLKKPDLYNKTVSYQQIEKPLFSIPATVSVR
jgi:hypothetical protein